MQRMDAIMLSAIERYQLLEQCWLTYSHASSTLVDLKLVEGHGKGRSIPLTITPETDDMKFVGSNVTVTLYGNPMPMEQLLEYKALIMLDGNDLLSGLKWAVFSNSIILMPEPLLSSWSMEEMLVPWVHYIPITVMNDDNGNSVMDTEEKMQWIIDNDEKLQEIAKAGKLWIADLVLHPDARTDKVKIADEIAQRYVTHFASHLGFVENTFP
jgi:Glycosyl transferase family 90